MNTIIRFVLLTFLTISYSFAQVGIGTPTPHASAILQLETTTKGFLLPRYFGTTPGDPGLVRYNSSSVGCLEYHDGSSWRCTYPSSSPSFTANVSAITSHLMFPPSATAFSSYGGVIQLIYTGGNGGLLPSQTVTNVGASAGQLTANRFMTTLSVGSGAVNYNVTGVPTTPGQSFFILSIADKIYVVPFTIN